MNKVILTVIAALLIGLSSCTPSENTIVMKKVYQNRDIAGMGMLKDLTVEEPKKVLNFSFQVSHTFFNPMFEKEMRVTKVYRFDRHLDSILEITDVSTEMKSAGEWVAINNPFKRK